MTSPIPPKHRTCSTLNMLLEIQGVQCIPMATFFSQNHAGGPRVARKLPVFLGNVHYEVSHQQLVRVLGSLTGICLEEPNVQLHYHKGRTHGEPQRRRGSATLWIATPEEQRVLCGLHGRLYLTPHTVYVTATAAQMDTVLPTLLENVRGARKAMVVEMPKEPPQLPRLPEPVAPTVVYIVNVIPSQAVLSQPLAACSPPMVMNAPPYPYPSSVWMGGPLG